MADGRRSLREAEPVDTSAASSSAGRAPAAPEEPAESPPAADRPARPDAPERRPEPRSERRSKVRKERAERVPLKLERLIHERIRLGIVSALAVNHSLSFNDLKTSLRTTDGNLSVHARKLERAGYVSCEKTFKGRIPRTVYRLTPEGRAALERYLGHMEAIIQTTRRSPDGP